MNKGYAICFNEWALNEKIKNELRLLLIISSLTAKDGYCFASNKYLADLFSETEQTISKKIKNLENYGYIEIQYEKRGWEVTNRKIRLTKILMDDYEKSQQTINENLKYNNTSINNINNNIYRHFENIFTRTLNSIEVQMIDNWLKDKTEKEIINAINECAKSNIDNLKYIEKVLYSKKKKVNPSWFNEEIGSSEIEPDDEFKNFIEEFRNDR